MSLSINTSAGVDLVEQPPQSVRIAAYPPLGGRVPLQVTVTESDTLLPYQYLTGTIYWDDGTQPVVYNGSTALTLDINTFRNLQPGSYTVRIEAHNYRAPVWDEVSVNFPFLVKSTAEQAIILPIIYGPILPKDDGFPNTGQWLYNTGYDVEILVSSVKMLLTTAKGERIMQPEYGTNLRLILFELETKGIESMVQQEIVDALNQWEPRVSLQFLTVEKTGERDISVNATFASKLNQQSFMVPMVFTA